MPVLESRASEAAVPPEQEPERAGAAAPRVWLLLDDRPGHTTQVVGLAEALGWPYETKPLRFTALNRLSNRLLGASRLALDAGASAELSPPWPDLVIAMGRRSAPRSPLRACRRRQSAGPTSSPDRRDRASPLSWAAPRRTTA